MQYILKIVVEELLIRQRLLVLKILVVIYMEGMLALNSME